MRLSLATAAVALVATAAAADILVTSDATYFGRVLATTPQQVTFSPGCRPHGQRQFAAQAVREIVLDPRCTPYETPLPSAGLAPPCDKPRIEVTEVALTGSPVHLLAQTVSMGEQHVVIDLGVHGSLRGQRAALQWLLRRQVCPDILERQTVPDLSPAFCHEPFHIAVNFSLAPIFNNQVFTKGFSVHVAFDGALDEATEHEVSDALQSAVLIWTSVLQDHRKALTEPLASYVNSIILSSANYQLLVPPYVVPVRCADLATMQVHWATSDDRVFPTRGDYLAKAQIQGRTIVVNARDFRFAYDLRRRAALPPGSQDLITVMLHELGHNFGLRHAPPGTPSVMAEVDPADYPTEYDAQQLLHILAASIQGTAPGAFNPETCGGLRAAPKQGP